MEQKPRASYIVCARKIPADSRDVFNAHATAYEDVDGGADGVGVMEGERVYYKVDLNEDGHKAFNGASNRVYLERVQDVHAVDIYADGSPVELPPDTQINPTVRAASVEAQNTGLAQGAEMDALRYCWLPGAWAEGARGQDVILYVGDTGVDGSKLPPSHKSRFIAAWDWYGGNGIDRNSHGTWCVGVAASPPSVRWISGKVLNDAGSGGSDKIIAFIRRAVKDAINRKSLGVISLSLGFPGTSVALEDACSFARANGVLVVAATGNNDGPVLCPANCPSAYGVAAVDRRNDGKRADFSNFGREVSFAGPGVNERGVNGVKSGTSMATPFVAAVAVCVLGTSRTALRGEEKSTRVTLTLRAMRRTANPRGQGNRAVGYGVPRARLAVRALADTASSSLRARTAAALETLRIGG